MRRVAVLALILAAPAALRPATAAVSSTRAVEVAPGISLALPAGWSEAPRFYRNASEFVRLPVERQAEAVSAEEAAARGSRSWTPRLIVLVEDEASHEVAVRRLADVAREKGRGATLLAVQGWPAVASRARVELPPRAESAVHSIPAWVLTTTVAVGNRVVKLEARFPAAASETELAEAAAIGRRLATPAGDPAAAKRDLARVRSEAAVAPSPRKRSGAASALPSPAPPPTPPPPAGVVPPPGGSGAPAPQAPLGAGIFAQRGAETEVAVSGNGRYVVVASGSATRASADRGQSFPSASGMPFPNFGDASLAWGQSDTFYLAGIKQNSTCSGNNATNGCHTGMARSTDHGQSFTATTDAVICPVSGSGSCFPDQEHIAADRVNAGTAAADQVYVVWRNFPAGAGAIPSIVCSSDGGANWSAPVAVDTTGDKPRVTVGGDGSVYVVYATSTGSNTFEPGTILLHRYGSCTAGLTSAGSSVPVTSYTGVDCRNMPGLDRCNFRNTMASFTVAVDDTSSSHVYVTYADNTGSGNENVVVRDSLDGGSTWTGNATLNSGVKGRRFMPWSCALGGQLYAGWYDGRNATAANDDRVRYFRGSASGSGGGLTAGAEADVSGADDALCASGWPCVAEFTSYSESCSIQPQLAGICLDGSGNPTSAANPQRCDFDEPPNCPSGFSCQTQGAGCPKYGDYTGIACGGGLIVFSWASATPPAGVVGTPPPGINTFVSGVKAPGPQIQVPGGIDFGQGCVGAPSTKTLDVCNTGQTNLVVTAVTASNPRFSVTAPSSGFPVTVAPGSCFPFQAVFTAAGPGSQAGALTVASNDPANPSTAVAVSASTGSPDIRVTGSTDFGVASAWTPAEKTVAVCNTGTCSLSVSAASASCAEFELITNPFPATLAPGACLDLVVRFVPHRPGRKVCTLTVASNDPSQPAVTRTLTAHTPPFFSLHAGLVEPHGAFHTVAGHGGTLNLDFLYSLTSRWAWDVRLGASRFDGRSGQPDVDLTTLSANARFTLNPGGPVHLFVNGGLGLYDFRPGDFVGGGNLGAGLSVPLGHLFALEATYNFHAAFNASPGRELSQAQLGLLVSF